MRYVIQSVVLTRLYVLQYYVIESQVLTRRYVMHHVTRYVMEYAPSSKGNNWDLNLQNVESIIYLSTIAK